MLHRCFVYHDRMPTRQQNMSEADAVKKASPLPIALVGRFDTVVRNHRHMSIINDKVEVILWRQYYLNIRYEENATWCRNYIEVGGWRNGRLPWAHLSEIKLVFCTKYYLKFY